MLVKAHTQKQSVFLSKKRLR